MRALIIGLGYAGNRYLRAFQNARVVGLDDIKLAYHSRGGRCIDLPYYASLEQALNEFNPNVIVLSVTDGHHYEIIKKLNNYRGFVICEKPLVAHQDDLDTVQLSLKKTAGFCLDMVERYSECSTLLRNFVKTEKLKPLRVNFYWGKDRLYDPRPTTGIGSEIIHPLDLIQWILRKKILVSTAAGITSDFAVNSKSLLDSVFLVGNVCHATCTGYSSFVNIVRQRTVDFTFVNKNEELIFAHMVFDTPNWDQDYLKIWHKGQDNSPLVEHCTKVDIENSKLHTIVKLTRQVEDVLNFLLHGQEPAVNFTSLEESIELQKMLNLINAETQTHMSPSLLIGDPQKFIAVNANLEQLG
ncbi:MULTISPECIES: Gfo/Idh/MocA family oxidoreductase [unclassified Bartonella]|uniref:Gfo/Idh/MocA family oxidoreductase n=1 Tax=unclassified Bartonella TaxID=2645622 RepID=UPI0035D11153